VTCLFGLSSLSQGKIELLVDQMIGRYINLCILLFCIHYKIVLVI